MEKKLNHNTKDFLLQSLTKEIGIDEGICEKVVMWAYKQAKEQTSLVSSVELSGFGTLLISQYKVNKELNKIQERLKIWDEEPSTLKREIWREAMNRKTEYLKTKLRG